MYTLNDVTKNCLDKIRMTVSSKTAASNINSPQSHGHKYRTRKWPTESLFVDHCGKMLQPVRRELLGTAGKIWCSS